jgi:hypothetical protein
MKIGAVTSSREFRIERRLLGAACLTLLAVGACDDPPPDFGLSSLNPSGHMLDSGTVDFCFRQGWDTCPIWIATDDQRFHIGEDSLGPVAFIAPASDLATKQSRSGFQVLEAVAMIRVDEHVGTPLPDSYTAFNLAPAFNCVYAKFVVGTGYQAYVVAPVQGPLPCPPSPANPGSPFAVIEENSTSWPKAEDIPNVARFHEGTNRVTRRPRTFFGFKCGAAWCMVLPSETQPDALPGEGSLPVIDPADHTKLAYSPGHAATVGPGEGASLNGLQNFEGRWVHAATVHFRGPPTDKKYSDSWNFRAGMTEVYLQKERGTDRWAGRVKRQDGKCRYLAWLFPGTCIEDLVAARVDHNKPNIAATARFRWDEKDEGIWVRCDDGCCQVSAD